MRVDRSRVERKLASALLAVATFSMIMSWASMGAATGTYQARLERDAARSPLPIADSSPGSGRFLPVSDNVGTQWVDVFLFEPGRDSQIPPGLSEWPEPGEVVLSPELVDTPVGDAIVKRYGTRSNQVISVEALASPTEPLAYVRPHAGTVLPDRGHAFTDFGFPDSVHPFVDGQWGGPLRQPPLEIVLGAMVIFLLIPSFILMIVAARTGSSRRDRQVQVLAVLGASRSHRRSYLEGSTRTPMLIGAGVAGVILLAILVVDWRIPAVGYVLRASDARRGFLLTAILAFIGAALAAFIVRSSNRFRPRLSSTRPQAAPFKERWWKIILLPAVCFAFMAGFSWTLRYTDNYARTIFIYIGIICIALTMPPFIGAVCALAAKSMVCIGVKRGFAGWLIAGRRVLAEPRGVRRLTNGIALVIVLTGHAMVVGTFTNPDQQAAEQLNELVDGSVVAVDLRMDAFTQDALQNALTESAQFVAVVTPDVKGKPGFVQLVATCDVLQSLNLKCHQQTMPVEDLPHSNRLVFLMTLTYARQVDVVPGEPMRLDTTRDERSAYQFYAMTADGEPFPLEAIRTELAHTIAPAPEVMDVAESWSLGTQRTVDVFAWLPLFAGVSVLILVLAAGGALLGDGNVGADQISVTRMWSPPPTFSGVIAAGTVLVPSTLAIVIAALVTLSTTYPMTLPPVNGTLPSGFWVATIGAPLAFAGALTALAAAIQHRRVKKWVPSQG